MSEHQRYEHGFGPVYSVPLIDKLPLNRENPGGMLQQMPSAADLEGIRTYRQGARVCAGYEVLLNHWRLQQAEIERLNAELDRLREWVAAVEDGYDRQQGDAERLRGLAVRAWHSFRSGLSLESGCDCGLTDADIEELVRMAAAANDKLSDQPPA